MIEIKDTTQTDPEKDIRAITGTRLRMHLEVTNGKITYIKYDESNLSAAKKTELADYLTANNPNLIVM